MFMASLVNNEYGNMGFKVSKGGIQKQVILDPKLSCPQLRDMGKQYTSHSVIGTKWKHIKWKFSTFCGLTGTNTYP